MIDMSFKVICRSAKTVDLNLYNQIPDCVISLVYKESYEILSYLILCYKRQYRMVDADGYTLLTSVKLKEIFGYNYFRGLKELLEFGYIEWKVIECNTGKPLRYSKEMRKASSYRITRLVEKCIIGRRYRFIPVRTKYSIVKPKNGIFKLKYKSKNPKILKLLAAYSGISVDPSWLDVFKCDSYYPQDHYKYPAEPINKYSLFVHCRWIIENILNKTLMISAETESGRVFHAILELTKIIRPFIRKNGEKLVNIDAKSFHPFLIASFIADKDRREEYLAIVRKDFYEIFVDKNHPRDKIKVLLQKWLSGRKTKDPKVLEIGRWYEEKFPDVALKMKELKKKKTTFQMCLQQLESSIFVDEVFMKAGFWCLPMHDGLCVLQKDVEAARKFIDGACESRLGYRIPLD
jgi:hypothetical protein